MILPAAETLGLYLSVPFCRAKCSFCNFASGVGSDATIARYLDRLCSEIEGARHMAERLRVALPSAADSLYFGGGTPSLLSPAQLTRLVTTLRGEFAISASAEITMEAAPGQIREDLLEAALTLGVNRVSLGVQSFIGTESAAVGRLHTPAECLDEIERLRAAGVRSVAVDLIAGLPGQTRDSWQESLELASASAADHVSVYMLEVDEDSRLGREVLAGGVRYHAHEVPDEELTSALYEYACATMPARGFAQYEISNFARLRSSDGVDLPAAASRHNLKYWTRTPYLGLGLDAHSMLPRKDGGELRFANADDMPNYELGLRAKPAVITPDQAFEEALFLGLRLCEGVSQIDLAQAFGPDRVAAVVSAVDTLINGDLMRQEQGRWLLTPGGRLLSNDVFARLLECVAA